MNRKLRKNQSHCICCDHHGASFTATRHLIERGHRDIAFITGSMDSPTALDRLAGYKAALTASGLPVREALIAFGKWTPESGAQATAGLLAGDISFSALVASNDDMAVGAMKTLNASGLRVPADVSLIGFDNIPTASFLQPALTSIKDSVSDMINEVIERLISMLDGGYLSSKSLFSSRLVLRDSVQDGPHR